MVDSNILRSFLNWDHDRDRASGIGPVGQLGRYGLPGWMSRMMSSDVNHAIKNVDKHVEKLGISGAFHHFMASFLLSSLGTSCHGIVINRCGFMT